MYKNAPQGPTYFSRVFDLSFYVLGNEENIKDGNVKVLYKEIMMKQSRPTPEGIYDPHMGTTDHAWNCATCRNKKTICPGHFGTYDLKYPVKSPLYRDELLRWLKIVCYYCGSIVVSIKKVIKPSKYLSELVKNVKKVKTCPSCGKPHMQVARDKVRPSVFYRTIGEGKNIKTLQFYNHQIEQVLQRIPDSVVLQMGKPLRSHPKKFIIKTLRVPPNTIRPDIRRINGERSNISDTTALLKTIVEINDALPEEIPPPELIKKELDDMYFNIDITFYTMVKGGGGGEVKMVTNTNKPPVSIADRLLTKTGRIRSNLMGKRTNYMIRSVITGDSRLRVNEVGVPMIHARDLEIPETVSAKNMNRLMTYFLNGTERYPGCKRIIKKSSGSAHRVEYMKNYQLQIGDIVMRDMITGDVVDFNRQPSLLFSNISCMRVVVMNTGETLRINPSVCNYFNADFDGDQMNAIVNQNIMARIEAKKISCVARWFISPQNQAPLVGAFQDGLIGISELSKDGLSFNKWEAMCLFSDITTRGIDRKFRAKSYDNRSLISRLLPAINIIGASPSVYKPQYAHLLKYNPKDTKVVIKRGNLISGIIDKDISGQGVRGSIFHIVANEYGNDVALQMVYDLQQIVHRFFLYKGYTVGVNDINISKEAMREVKRRIAGMILEANKVTQRMDNGKLIAPIGTQLKDFYENEQVSALSAGDELVLPILADVDLNSNGMLKLILSGSKGKIPNFIAINGAIGIQTINGKRFGPQVGWGRSSPYFVRYDTSPAASGYISTSFREGVANDVYPFTAGEARHGLISNALSTSITGYQNRISIKNLETISVDNLRKSTKGMNVVQPLYGENGLDQAKSEYVKFPTIMISNDELEERFHTKASSLNKMFNNGKIQQLLDEEFERIKEDRDYFRRLHLGFEGSNPQEYILNNGKQMPVNIQRIIDDTVHNYSSVFEELDDSKKILDPAYVIKSVNDLCENIGYVFLNGLQKRLKKKIPKHIISSTKMMCILIRSYLSTSYLVSKNIINPLLDIIIQKIVHVYKKSLIEYGTAVGILAAQCISEPMTQFILDSKHRTGGQGGTKTDEITRIKEILGAKPTSKISPHMLIMVKEEYENDKIKVQEIANHIEMMKFSRFISATHIFFEEYGKPVHPRFVHEEKVIRQIEKHNFGSTIPNDLARWCIRYEVDKEELILRSIKLENIVLKIRQNHPEVYIIHTPENADVIFIRCYLRNTAFKDSKNFYEDSVIPLMENIKEVIVRGIDGLINTSVSTVIRTYELEDGSLTTKKVFAINTVGTNMPAVLNNPFIDPYRTQSDSVEEIEHIFGITAARNKIIDQLVATLKNLNRVHCAIFADEMVYSGSVTSIQKTGLQLREMSNVTLRLSFQTAIQVVQDAAINGLVDRIHGISGPLVMGASPCAGTSFNKLIVNEEFVRANTKTLTEQVDDL